jgi:hypothetical protein
MSGKLQEVLDKLQKANNTIAEQRKEIERQKALAIKRIVEGTSKELSDEEINKLWAESNEDGIAMQQGFTTQQHYFAHLILKKASEK